MPYERVGALKFSDHHVRSPLLNIDRACQTCHRSSEEEVKGSRRGDRRAGAAPGRIDRPVPAGQVAIRDRRPAAK